jgi:hypothetical protein
MSSLIKFESMLRRDSSGKPLHWGRADEDGAPFRGNPLMLTEEEYLDRVVKVKDAHNRVFDTSDPKQNRQYLLIVEKAAHGLAQVMYQKKRWRKKGKKGPYPVIYVEWLEFYMQDGSPKE